MSSPLYDAPVTNAPRTPTHEDLAVDALMAKIQEFASTWSLAGGPLDDGSCLEAAHRLKAELAVSLHAAQACPDEPMLWDQIEPLTFRCDDAGQLVSIARQDEAGQPVEEYYHGTPIEAEPLLELRRTGDVNAFATWAESAWTSKSAKGFDERDLFVAASGLAEEAGEVLGVLKKSRRDGKLDRVKLAKELGDVAYYWARLCTAHGFQASEILALNMAKIEDRRARGALHGAGDDR